MKFLSGPARAARRVYILGDLFEYWIGDDAGLRDYGPEAKALRALVRYGVPVCYQHGNRDFALGRRFAEACGVQILPDPAVIDLEGRRTLISHGDLFCTDDRGYQRWRRISRNPLLLWLALHLPESRRRRLAGAIRGASAAQRRDKPADIMDVNAQAIARAFHRYQVTRLVHGHTHRPAAHVLQINGKTCERIVLPDWRPGCMEYLRADASGLKRLAV